MTSSDRRSPRPVPPPQGEPSSATPGGHAYARFIPREEVRSVTAWSPHAFGEVERRSANGDRRQQAAPPPPPPSPEALLAEQALALKAARQAGYQDGYRDGLVALESFKQSFARQTTAEVGQLLEACDAQLLSLQTRLAEAVADTAVQLARQVIRAELKLHPQQVAAVAREAVEALLASARRIELTVHPDDAALIAEGAAEVLERRSVRVVADATLERGGCRVSSDIGQLDASLGERWRGAAALLGRENVAWTSGDADADADIVTDTWTDTRTDTRSDTQPQAEDGAPTP